MAFLTTLDTLIYKLAPQVERYPYENHFLQCKRHTGSLA